LLLAIGLMSKQTLQLHSTVLSIHSLALDADIPPALLKQPLFLSQKRMMNCQLFALSTLLLIAKTLNLIGKHWK